MCSFGVFPITQQNYDSPFIRFSVINQNLTSNQCEIYALTEAVKSAIEFCSSFPFVKTVTFRGDSFFVISQVNDGFLLSIKNDPKFPNSALWIELKNSVAKLSSFGIEILYKWVSRGFNREADQLCNVALDKCPINHSILSSLPTHDFNSLFEKCIDKIRVSRFASFRSLPVSLGKLFAGTCISLLETFSSQSFQARQEFFLLPSLLSVHSKKCKIENRSDFKFLRGHILLLRESNYLASAMCSLLEKNAKENEATTTNIERKVKNLCSQGLYSKCLEDKDITIPSITENMKLSLQNLFPQSSLPSPLPTFQTHLLDLDFSDVVKGFMKLKRGRAPGTFGWTKELLFFLKICPPSTQIIVTQIIVTQIFKDILNDNLSQVEKQACLRSVLIPFYYPAKNKYRPILLQDAVIKICWNIVLPSFSSCPSLAGTPQCAGLKRQCENALHLIQASLNQNKVVVCIDSVNAFNSVARSAIFSFLKKDASFYPYFRFINLMYSNVSYATLFDGSKAIYSIPMSNGVRQGCVSSPLFYCLAAAEVAKPFGQRLLQVVDDIFLIEDLLSFPSLVSAFSTINQTINVEKLKIIASKTRRSEIQKLIEGRPEPHLRQKLLKNVALYWVDSFLPISHLNPKLL